MALQIKVFRLPFIFLAMICLVFGVWSGLNRIGWSLSLLPLTMHHGAIMVGGFLGTLISLEKIIPLKNKFLFAIPAISGASVLFFFLSTPRISFACLLIASAGLCGVFIYYLVKEKNLIYLLMLGGSLCWFTGNLLLITKQFYPLAFPWWIGFALCIISSERMELMKFLPVSNVIKSLLLIFLLLFIAGLLFSFHGLGNAISGFALVCTSVWLMRYDIVGISIRKKGLAKFVATALLAGYVAMMLTGIFFFGLGGQPLAYDVLVHTFFIGFVFSMIFAHGPIILPGVLGIAAKPYHPLLYVWLVLLHLSLVTRIAGDLILNLEVRRISGWMSAVAIFAYFATIATITTKNYERDA